MTQSAHVQAVAARPSRDGLLLPRDLASVGAARRFVWDRAQVLGAPAEACDVAVLLASETVTNAVRHGAGDVSVHVGAAPGGLRVEVGDDSPDHGRALPQDLDAEGGRGLSIVELLAERWGVRADPPGKVVWFEVPLP